MVGHGRVAPGAPKIEKDIAKPKRGDVSLVAPQPDLFLPLACRLSPQRIGGHDVSLAQRQPDPIQITGHAFGQVDEPAVDLRMAVVRIIAEDETVVLVREKKVLAAPPRSHDDDREIHRRRPPPLVGHGPHVQIGDAPVDVVVDVGQKRLDLGRRQAFPKQLIGQFHLRGLDLRQAGDVVVLGQDVDLPHQGLRRGGQGVGKIEHAA